MKQQKIKPIAGSGAFFSDGEKYRHALWRIWDTAAPCAMFIGLNPSTANATENDPTITRVFSIAKFNGFGGIYMLNLFSFVATNPDDLVENIKPAEFDTRLLKSYARLCRAVVFCWGNFKQAQERAKIVIPLFPRARCLVQNKNGSPKHPLYCLTETKFIPFKPQ